MDIGRFKGLRIISKLHTRIGKTAPVQANRVVALLSAMFSMALDLELVATNPAANIRKFNEAKRDRYLESDELPVFLRALRAYPHERSRDFLLVALFTAQRRGNVATMQWSELDLNRALWQIPGDKTKNGSPHDVPLVPEAMRAIERRGAVAEDGQQYVFPGRGGGHLISPEKPLRTVCEDAGIQPVRLHDLRRTAASWASAAGVPYPTVQTMLGHTVPDVTGVYTRVGLDSLRDGFKRMADAMLQAEAGGGGR